MTATRAMFSIPVKNGEKSYKVLIPCDSFPDKELTELTNDEFGNLAARVMAAKDTFECTFKRVTTNVEFYISIEGAPPQKPSKLKADGKLTDSELKALCSGVYARRNDVLKKEKILFDASIESKPSVVATACVGEVKSIAETKSLSQEKVVEEDLYDGDAAVDQIEKIIRDEYLLEPTRMASSWKDKLMLNNLALSDKMYYGVLNCTKADGKELEHILQMLSEAEIERKKEIKESRSDVFSRYRPIFETAYTINQPPLEPGQFGEPQKFGAGLGKYLHLSDSRFMGLCEAERRMHIGAAIADASQEIGLDFAEWKYPSKDAIKKRFGIISDVIEKYIHIFALEFMKDDFAKLVAEYESALKKLDSNRLHSCVQTWHQLDLLYTRKIINECFGDKKIFGNVADVFWKEIVAFKKQIKADMQAHFLMIVKEYEQALQDPKVDRLLLCNNTWNSLPSHSLGKELSKKIADFRKQIASDSNAENQFLITVEAYRKASNDLSSKDKFKLCSETLDRLPKLELIRSQILWDQVRIFMAQVENDIEVEARKNFPAVTDDHLPLSLRIGSDDSVASPVAQDSSTTPVGAGAGVGASADAVSAAALSKGAGMYALPDKRGLIPSPKIVDPVRAARLVSPTAAS